MSAEQGDVAMIREALRDSKGNIWSYKTYGGERALDRLAVALERAERERDEANAKRIRDLESWEERANASENKALFHDDALARAEKAERALAGMREALERLADETDSLGGVTCGCVQFARAALRPEDTSDES